MPIETFKIHPVQANKILEFAEGHFRDLKAIEISPAKLTRTLCAFANAEGGELYVGIDELKSENRREWRGFANEETANGHIQAFESLFPLGSEFEYSFLSAPELPGVVLQATIHKTKGLRQASDGKVYVRRGAQNLPLTSEEDLARLKYNKGLTSFETELVAVETEVVENSETTIAFMLEVVPTAEPENWFRKQRLTVENKPVAASIILFADQPQAILPKRCGIKIYRYRTNDLAGWLARYTRFRSTNDRRLCLRTD